MNILETDIEIGADGSLRLLSPLPAWLKPGRAHVRLTVESVQEQPKHQKTTEKPDFLARQQALFGSRVLPDSQAILDELRADRSDANVAMKHLTRNTAISQMLGKTQ